MQRLIRKIRILLYQLPVQMVVALVGLVILTAALIGLPAIYLIRQQLDLQAWALVEQGRLVGQAALDARRTELAQLALLTAQRPTLQRLLENGDSEELRAYLQTLQAGMDVDSVLLCDNSQNLLAQSGSALTEDACRSEELLDGIYHPTGQPQLAWLMAWQSIPASQGMVVRLADRLDAGLAGELKTQTGLDYLLVLDGQPLTATFPDPMAAWTAVRPHMQSVPTGHRLEFTLDERPYYAFHSRGETAMFDIFAALPVDNISQTQARLTLGMLGGMLLVVLISSVLGVYLARRISLPLERLRRSAVGLRMGDLTTPVQTASKVKEVTQVAAALEDARIALQAGLAELRREKEWTDHLLGAVVEGIVTLDRGGRITFFSQGAERITGWGAGAVVGRKADEVFRPAEGSEPFTHQALGPGGRQTLVAVRLKSRTATLAVTGARLAPIQVGQGPARLQPPTWLEPDTQPLHPEPQAGVAPPSRLDGGRAGTVLVFRDVSDEEAMHRLLGDFLADITHEFRTPLSALAASMELLIDQLPSLRITELSELLEAQRLGILGLQTLIDNLLEGASIEAGRFRVQPRRVELAKIVKDATRTMQPLYDKYRRRLKVNPPAGLPAVQADPRRTVQVLVNLLSNAVKWSPEGSEVEVALSLEDFGAGACVKLSVLDRGPGVPPERRGDLFTRFAHAGTGSRADVGAGIGLSVVKAIVEAQGGQVGMSDREGGGTVFWFTLPAADSAAASLAVGHTSEGS